MRRVFATVDGIRMSWAEQGQGKAVILIHGIPTSPELWRKVLPHLQGVRALAWEMVGFGQSIPEGRTREISVARQADYLVAWMRHLGVSDAVLAGHDLGGGVAQIAAVHHPELCRGLFLTNAIGYDSWPIPSVRILRALAPLVRQLPDRLFRAVMAPLFRRGHERADEAAEAMRVHLRNYGDTDGAAALVRQIRALDVNDTLSIADRLPDLDVPARIVWGAADPFQKVAYGERFSRDLRAPLRRIAGGRHFTPEDHPATVGEEIMALAAET